MINSFFFYDLETSGFDPKEARIMQFAGRRTDMDLKYIGDPINVLMRMTDDVLPDPSAILLTGITPQKTIQEGITEAEFMKLFYQQIAIAGTIFVGFNSVRFDDEFMRYLHYRNFYDAYEWQWKDDRSKWDILDVARMTRALRPEGINWPVGRDGVAANRLVDLSAANSLDHLSAHDALSDVDATIGVARLIKVNQPRLFEYLLNMRTKKSVEKLVQSGQPFVYTSGKYDSLYEKTSVVAMVSKHPNQEAALVYDLRFDPTPFSELSPEELADAWSWHDNITDSLVLPVKTLKYNRCPAVAPLSVLDKNSLKRLRLRTETIEENHKKLDNLTDFPERLQRALAIMDKKRESTAARYDTFVDGMLYTGFVSPEDKKKMSMVRALTTNNFNATNIVFKDERLNELLLLYQARNYRTSLSDEARHAWEAYRFKKLTTGGNSSRITRFSIALQSAYKNPKLSSRERAILEELQLYAESIMPANDD